MSAKNEKPFIHRVIKTPWLALRKRVGHLTSHNDEPSTNSNYNGVPIQLEDIEVWEDFMKNNEIADMLDNPQVREVLFTAFTEEELEKMTWGEPISGGKISEQTFERLWGGVQHVLNLVQKKCAAKVQDTHCPIFIVTGDGSCARWKAPEASSDAERKKPDYAGYEEVPDSGQYVGDGPKYVYNRIPGDAKLFRKIRRSMLPPDGSECKKKIAKREAGKVLNQIHDYVDQHEARYGYVVNDQELIFFRRRGTGWGHMDISPAIRHDVDGDEEGTILNSKLVLFYFHLVVANDENQWRLKSCAPMIPRRNKLPRTAKATVPGELVPRSCLEQRFGPTAFVPTPDENTISASGRRKTVMGTRMRQ
jgi:hypothetical protein